MDSEELSKKTSITPKKLVLLRFPRIFGLLCWVAMGFKHLGVLGFLFSKRKCYNYKVIHVIPPRLQGIVVLPTTTLGRKTIPQEDICYKATGNCFLPRTTSRRKTIPQGNMGATKITWVELDCFWDYFWENILKNILLKVFKKILIF